MDLSPSIDFHQKKFFQGWPFNCMTPLLFASASEVTNYLFAVGKKRSWELCISPDAQSLGY